MASISVRSGAPGSPTHVSGSSSNGAGAGGGGSSGSGPVCRTRRNGLQDVDLNTFISEEMALHLDSTGSASAGGTRKRNSTQCSDVITDSPTHKRNRMIWFVLWPVVWRGLQSQGQDWWAYVRLTAAWILCCAQEHQLKWNTRGSKSTFQTLADFYSLSSFHTVLLQIINRQWEPYVCEQLLGNMASHAAMWSSLLRKGDNEERHRLEVWCRLLFKVIF